MSAFTAFAIDPAAPGGAMVGAALGAGQCALADGTRQDIGAAMVDELPASGTALPTGNGIGALFSAQRANRQPRNVR